MDYADLQGSGNGGSNANGRRTKTWRILSTLEHTVFPMAAPCWLCLRAIVSSKRCWDLHWWLWLLDWIWSPNCNAFSVAQTTKTIARNQLHQPAGLDWQPLLGASEPLGDQQLMTVLARAPFQMITNSLLSLLLGTCHRSPATPKTEFGIWLMAFAKGLVGRMLELCPVLLSNDTLTVG